MPGPNQAEYDWVHTQITQRKLDLKTRSIPSTLKQIPLIIRHNRLHPLLSEIANASDDQASFTFNGIAYSISFKKGRLYSMPTGPRLCSGTLIVQAGATIVLESSFEAKEDEWGLTFYYQDTSIYRQGDWVEELLKLKRESDELRKAREKEYFQSKTQLAALRNSFGIPSQAVPLAVAISSPLPDRPARPKPSLHALGLAAGRVLRRILC